MLKEYRFGELYIRHAIDENPVDNDFTMHIHEQCEIYFFVSGNVEYLVEGSRYPLSEETIMIMRPAEVHKPRILDSTHYERYAINFPTSFVHSIDPKSRLLRAFLDRPLGQSNMLTVNQLDMSLVKKLFSDVFLESTNEYDKELTVKTHIFMLLDLIGRAFDRKAVSPSKPLSISEQILAHVNHHIYDNLSVPELAAHFYLSTSHFNRIFKQATGASPWEYITKKRLTSAKEKIHNGSTAQTAAESCGFHDYSSFYRAYVKYFGCSPTS